MSPRTSVDWAGWLRPEARPEVEAALAADEAAEPRRWDHWVDRYSRSRFHRLPVESLALLGEAREVQVIHPLADLGFLGALARAGGRGGFGPRTDAVRTLFGDLLPAETVGRTSKAEFGAALWGPEARSFATEWRGTGLDAELVDSDVLRTTWLEENPPLAAATLLQDAWLASRTA
jgi:asparagine synthase (glutamine-hydrolysing)